MKKTISLILAILMALSLIACGSQTEPTTESTPQTLPVEATEPIPQVEVTEPVEEAMPTEAEPAPEQDSFDASWASNEFEALLPKLPFDGWSTEQVSDSEYKMELGGLNDSTITDENGNTIGYGADKAALIAYLQSLEAFGFSVEETGGIEGYEYEWLVVDPSGNEIEFVCAEGYCWITIVKNS